MTRFVSSGGASLKGRVADSATGKPLSDVLVETHLGDSFMESATDTSGVFRLLGLPPGKRVKVWMIVKTDAFVAEYLDVLVPAEGETTDVGVIRLLRGAEQATHLGGWVGLFVGRRGRRNVVTALNPWLPADRAGIEVGDTILSVDGRDLEGLGPRATAFLIRGAPGTNATIAVQDRRGVVRRLELERVWR